MADFFGAFASVFLGASSVESDFFVIGFELNDIEFVWLIIRLKERYTPNKQTSYVNWILVYRKARTLMKPMLKKIPRYCAFTRLNSNLIY